MGRKAGREGKGRRGVEEREVETTAGRAGSGNASGERRSVAGGQAGGRGQQTVLQVEREERAVRQA